MMENSSTEAATPTSAPTRRRFLNWVWAFFGLAAMAEFGWLGVSFLNFRKDRSAPARAESIITAGPVEMFEPATVTAIPQGQLYLARLEDGGFLALSRTCTHLGCSLRWDVEQGKFICPCHGSSYNAAGEVLTAPAPRPLDSYPVRIENGIVKVDIATPQKRQRFEPGQVTRV